MQKKQKIKEKIEIRVNTPAWSHTEKSWYFLTKSNKEETAWSTGYWFPKKLCTLKSSEKDGVGILTVPKWLLDKILKK